MNPWLKYPSLLTSTGGITAVVVEVYRWPAEAFLPPVWLSFPIEGVTGVLLVVIGTLLGLSFPAADSYNHATNATAWNWTWGRMNDGTDCTEFYVLWLTDTVDAQWPHPVDDYSLTCQYYGADGVTLGSPENVRVYFGARAVNFLWAKVRDYTGDYWDLMRAPGDPLVRP